MDHLLRNRGVYRPVPRTGNEAGIPWQWGPDVKFVEHHIFFSSRRLIFCLLFSADHAKPPIMIAAKVKKKASRPTSLPYKNEMIKTEIVRASSTTSAKTNLRMPIERYFGVSDITQEHLLAHDLAPKVRRWACPDSNRSLCVPNAQG